ncbi:iron complex transport system substrate-binding protein [Streptosporangium becharense]|uniref:Iron complex transport system substrate-binding protein n=1 Tax=Streptosporangium becharense TaxID=1816182 RepID=A0A7W9MFB2_9ACTN|nr:Fe2+-enterobactin ABC transporter substrate-binding protein [Streptosporangium becharense]MBB2912315.1 iron complex transport system substrate-binding protein [Streptosporangium becharense]MBB5818862.1 iron complex transport system substrate-binding protein [Streptosporangium becharense]
MRSPIRRRWMTAVVVVATALGLSACGSGTDTAAGAGTGAAPAAGDVRKVQHELGSTDVPVAPKRVVSVSVTLTGHLLALEAPLVASQATAPGPFTDGNGFFKQWGDVATQRGVQVVYQGFEADIEKVIAAKPDLIIGSASGADSTSKVYDRLKNIAPTLLFRHDNATWQELTTKLGAALGLEANAAKVVSAYDKRVTEVKDKIKRPEQDIVVLRDNNTDIPVFTETSAQGAVLTALGFKIHPIDSSLAAASTAEGGARTDIVSLKQENVVKAIGDSSVFFVGHSADQIAATQAKPLWKDLAAVADKRVHDLGLDSFRIDYFSASSIVDRIEKEFAG